MARYFLYNLLGFLSESGEENSDDLFNPWRYASKRYDFETGLIFFGRRFYDPKVGRFITPDPMGYTDSINLYQYTLNNPFVNVDLFGLAIDSTLDCSRWFNKNSLPPKVKFQSFEEDYAIASQTYWKTRTPEDIVF